MQGRRVTFIAKLPGDGVYTLGLTNVMENVAIYERVVGRNVNSGDPDIDFYEKYVTVNQFNNPLGTGAPTLTVDMDAKVVWGEFTFTARGLNEEGANPPNLTANVTGSFLLRLEVVE